MDLCADGQGQVYATYQNGKEETVLALVDYQNRRLSQEVTIPCDGAMWTGGEDTLLMYGEGRMIMYSPERGEIAEILQLTQYHLKRDTIQIVKKLPEGNILAVNWESLNREAPVTVTRLFESQEEPKTQVHKTIITLLLPQIMLQAERRSEGSVFLECLEEFNLSSKEYEVVLEGVDLGESADLYAAMNTRLLARESADLIYLLGYQDIERYMARGYLEDLTPYLERSERLSRENYLDSVLQYYSMGDALYSIPIDFSIDTLGGKASELGEMPGWTVDEFLDWLESHPDGLAKEGLSPGNILSYCLMGGMDAYLDRENCRSYFEGKEFCGLLQRIRELQLEARGHWDDWDEVVKNGEKPFIDYLSVWGFQCCDLTERAYGEELVYKGFPTRDGTPSYYYSCSSMAILSRSEEKEGAYAFWEYYFTHRIPMQRGKFFTNLEELENSVEYTSDLYRTDTDSEGRYMIASKAEGLEKGFEWYPVMTRRQRDKQLAMMEYARADTWENMTIRGIILEEAPYYFAGVKSLEETCEVIQSRVQLYLDETGK